MAESCPYIQKITIATYTQETVMSAFTPGLIRDILKMGISPLTQFIWTYVTTAITLCCRVKTAFESWSSLDSIWTLEQFFAMRAQKTRPNSLDMSCLATSTKRSLVSVDNIVSNLSVLLSLCCAASLFHSFRHNIVNLFFTVSACDVQHLGNVLIWPNVNEAFHFVTAPS